MNPTPRAVTIATVSLALLVGHSGAGDSHRDRYDDAHGERALFTIEDFEGFGVEVMTAAPGTVDTGIELPAEVHANGDRLAHLAPRFAGVARAVHVTAGDRVQAGAVLAVVEGDRLSPFEIRAPFPGVVIDRHVTVGEPVAPGRTAFILADLSTVWIDVTVYQHVAVQVTPGQPVWISTGRGGPSAHATVSWVSPVLDPGTRAAVARVELSNPEGAWRPGMFATAVVSRPTPAPVVVPRGAVHRLEGRTVVFVVEAEHFEARPVRIGSRGRSLVAIADGLAAGERFAASRSFLVKAELAKGDAGHQH